jgi:hypothetical protein
MNKEDKDYVLSLGAIFLEENIFYIPNFLNENLVAKLLKETKEQTDWVYYERGRKFPDMIAVQDEETVKEMEEIYKKFSEWPSFGKNYENVKNFEMHDVKWIRKRGDGCIGMGMDAHWDGDPSEKYMDPKEDGTMKIPNRVKWGSVIYLNDDFEGGEINYIDFGISFKPKPGALICHKGDDPKYRHSVTNMTGIRYNLIFNFMYGDVNKPEPGQVALDFNGKHSSDDI